MSKIIEGISEVTEELKECVLKCQQTIHKTTNNSDLIRIFLHFQDKCNKLLNLVYKESLKNV